MSLAEVLADTLSEFRARFQGRHFGKFRALVVSVDDPKEVGRIRVRCPLLFGTETTAWCWPATGGPFDLPEEGEMVWVELEQGDTKKPPLWMQGPWATEQLPRHARGLPGIHTEQGIKGLEGGAIPPSSFNPSGYGKVHIWELPSGAQLSFDETEGEERVLLEHKTGAHLEMQSDGTICLGAVGHMRVQAMADWKAYVAGFMKTVVEGSFELTVAAGAHTTTVAGPYSVSAEGTMTLEVGASVMTVSGDNDETVNGTQTKLVMGNEYRQVGGQYSMSVSTDMFLNASGKGSLVVQNNVTNGGLPTDLAMEVSAYNGLVLVQSVDATGMAMASYLELEGTIGAADLVVELGGSEMSGLHLDSFGMVVLEAATMIQIGSSFAVEPAWLGIQAATLWTSLLVWLDTHTHTGNMGAPTTPPLVPSSASLTSLVTNCASTLIFLE